LNIEKVDTYLDWVAERAVGAPKAAGLLVGKQRLRCLRRSGWGAGGAVGAVAC
jgi:hypothetical protein